MTLGIWLRALAEVVTLSEQAGHAILVSLHNTAANTQRRNDSVKVHEQQASLSLGITFYGSRCLFVLHCLPQHFVRCRCQQQQHLQSVLGAVRCKESQSAAGRGLVVPPLAGCQTAGEWPGLWQSL